MVRKNVKKYVQLVCCGCQQTFDKEKREYDRQLKKDNNNFYCSLVCFNKQSRIDELSPFRFICNRSRRAAKLRNIFYCIDPEEIKIIWEKQNGICPYTGLKMVLPEKRNTQKIPTQVSIDRIDSNKEYTINNIELVCLSVNYAKHCFTKEQMLDFFKNVSILK